jgi:hypothetical protein
MVTAYHQTKLALSDAQMKALEEGKTVRLKFAQLNSPVPDDTVYLTAQQQKKLEKAHGAKVGCEIKFSKPQLLYHQKSGSGVLSNFLNGVRDKSLGAVGWVGDKGINLAGKLVGSQTGKLSSFVPDVYGLQGGADSLLKGGVDLGTKFTQGKLKQFISGLQSTKNGGAVLGNLKFRTAINRPLESQFRRPARMSLAKLLPPATGTDGGALFLPGTRR